MTDKICGRLGCHAPATGRYELTDGRVRVLCEACAPDTSAEVARV